MDQNVLAELERLEKAATPGPLFYFVHEDGRHILHDDTYLSRHVAASCTGMPDDQQAAMFELLSALRTHAPALLAAAREAERLRKVIREDIEQGDDCCCDELRNIDGEGRDLKCRRCILEAALAQGATDA